MLSSYQKRKTLKYCCFTSAPGVVDAQIFRGRNVSITVHPRDARTLLDKSPNCVVFRLHTHVNIDRVRCCHLAKESVLIISFSKMIDIICGRERNFTIIYS